MKSTRLEQYVIHNAGYWIVLEEIVKLIVAHIETIYTNV